MARRAPNPAQKYFLVMYTPYWEGDYVGMKAVAVRARSKDDVYEAIHEDTREGSFPPEAMEADVGHLESAGSGLYYAMGDEDETYYVQYTSVEPFDTLADAEEEALKWKVYNLSGTYRVDARGGLQAVKSRKNPRGHMRHNAESGSPEYYRRNLILPHEVIEPLYSWHGGQYTGVYSLASTGDHDYVSQSMVDRALSELESDYKKVKNKKDKKELGNLIGELEMVSSSPREFSTKEAGVGDVDSGYDTYGMRRDEVSFENPRRRVASVRRR